MKKYLILIAILIVNNAIAQHKKVLFIGNSFFASNNLPLLVDSLSIMNNDTLTYSQVLVGGAGFKEHSANPAVYTAIRSQKWDYVVLQDQSQRPSFPYNQIQLDVVPYAKQLVDSIRINHPCAIPVFFATWGYISGDAQWDSINTFLKMNTRLYNTYLKLAQDNSAHLIAGGWAFDAVREPNTGSIKFGELYDGDGKHPSIYGSYLSACLIYSHIFGSKTLYNDFRPKDMPTHYSEYLQSMADLTTSYYKSKSNYFPFANFDYENTVGSKAIIITDKSKGGYAHYWLFSDGFSSNLKNPTHIFDTFGTYVIGQYVKNDCGYFDTTAVTVYITDKIVVKNISEISNQKIVVFPNPSKYIITVQNDNAITHIYSMDGKLVKFYNNPAKSVDITNLNTGNYLLRTDKGLTQITKE